MVHHRWGRTLVLTALVVSTVAAAVVVFLRGDASVLHSVEDKAKDFGKGEPTVDIPFILHQLRNVDWATIVPAAPYAAVMAHQNYSSCRSQDSERAFAQSLRFDDGEQPHRTASKDNESREIRYISWLNDFGGDLTEEQFLDTVCGTNHTKKTVSGKDGRPVEESISHLRRIMDCHQLNKLYPSLDGSQAHVQNQNEERAALLSDELDLAVPVRRRIRLDWMLHRYYLYKMESSQQQPEKKVQARQSNPMQPQNNTPADMGVYASSTTGCTSTCDSGVQDSSVVPTRRFAHDRFCASAFEGIHAEVVGLFGHGLGCLPDSSLPLSELEDGVSWLCRQKELGPALCRHVRKMARSRISSKTKNPLVQRRFLEYTLLMTIYVRINGHRDVAPITFCTGTFQSINAQLYSLW